MYVKFDVNSSRNRAAINRKKKAMAEELQRQVEDRIKHGGDDEYTFPPLDHPRLDGSRNHPLYRTGEHLLKSLSHGYNQFGIWVRSSFIGARLLQHGTTGKGGTLPPVVPKTAKVLAFPAYAGKGKSKMIFAKKAEFRPRKFFRLARSGLLRLRRIFRES